jgi:two-component system OmpR family response regulator
MQILVIEDEARMASLLKTGLTEEGHNVIIAHDGTVGFEMAGASRFDVIVLDMMLPGIDGIMVASRLRAARNETPILALTARDAPPDIIRGLDAGVDDYITKPFPFEILLARLRAVSRRGVIPQPVVLRVADLTLDPSTRKVTRGAAEINLTAREFSLLELLMRNVGRVLERERILESVWGFDAEVKKNTLEAFVRLLRLKVDAHRPKLIQTVRGIGYSLRLP